MAILADVQSYTPGAILNLFSIDFSTTGLPSPPVPMYLYRVSLSQTVRGSSQPRQWMASERTASIRLTRQMAEPSSS